MLRSLTRLILPLAVLLACAPAAAASVQPYGTNDYGGFRNILPPGTNGLDNLAQLGAFEANHNSRPPHNDDQRAMYSNLTTAAGGITAQTIPNYYKDATFGVKPGDVDSARTESPESGVTITRDKQFGVPHIYGDTRAALMFGIGYATAEDRLFFIDVLRHSGNGNLASFAGGANVSMDQSVWANEPYTHQDLTNQVNYGMSHLPDGAQIFADASNYVLGINAYIAKAKMPLNMLTMMPAEYAAIGQPGGPQPFSLEDLVSIATLVGGIFGNGGGKQLSNAVLYENLVRRFGNEHFLVNGSPQLIVKNARKKKKVRHKRVRGGKRAHVSGIAVAHVSGAARTGAIPANRHHARHHQARHHQARHHKAHRRRHVKRRPSVDHSGFATFLSFDAPNDPEAPTTVHGSAFPYQGLPTPSPAVTKTIALPDSGSVQYANHVVAGAAPQAKSRAASSAVPGLLAFPRGMSNALLVSAKNSASGHPLAVMGPQVAYFAPQILMEEDIHGPGIDANGAAFPGVNLYVELGHGRDYAWSATSAGQNIIDTFAVPLCNPTGGAVATSSDYYVLRGQCVAMQTLTDHESWTPTAADQTPAGSITLQTQRTAFGIVTARATVHNRPVAYTNLRSTYMHELDSAAGFEQFNDPAHMHTPQAFFDAASKIGYTFNWFYTNNQHIAYFNSGQNPVRAPHTDPLFPSWSQYAWQGFYPSDQVTPTSQAEPATPQAAHPQVIDQSYLTSWNNKQAPGYQNPATGQEYSSIYRSQLLDNNINDYLRRDAGKLTLADLINAMGTAGTQDLRGIEVLPYALKVIGSCSPPARHPASPKRAAHESSCSSDPTLAKAVAELGAWVASGAHRINREHPGASGSYEQADAVRIMDAWWPLLVSADLQPTLGSPLLSQIESEFPTNDEPGHGVSGAHLGSAFDVGFYGIVQKDLRAVLRQPVAEPLNRIFCGNGSLARCRTALEGSLTAAAAEPPQQVYPADSVCGAGDQMCSDSIQFRPTGAITQPLIEWINRPTFQQADEIQGHGPG